MQATVGKKEVYENVSVFKSRQFGLSLFHCRMRIIIPALCGCLSQTDLDFLLSLGECGQASEPL